jgi:hypothetical protein
VLQAANLYAQLEIWVMASAVPSKDALQIHHCVDALQRPFAPAKSKWA